MKKVSITGTNQSHSGDSPERYESSDYLRLKRSTFRMVLVISILLAAAVSVYAAIQFIGTAAPSTPPFVVTAKLKLMNIEDTVVASGVIEGAATARVMPTEYTVTEILVSELDEVSEGQIIAKLDVSELSEKHMRAEAALEVSKFRYEAATMLFGEGAISEKDYLEAESAYKSDLITLNSNDVTEAGIIRSPISGVVISINPNAAMTNERGNQLPLFIIEDLSKLKMTAPVSEYEISKVKEGQSVIITTNVLSEAKAFGTVSKIAPIGEKRSPDSDEIVVPVFIDIDLTDDNRIIAGITGKAEIHIQETEEVLTTPNDAIFDDPVTGAPSIYKLERDNSIKLMHIRPGLHGQLYTELLDPVGLKAGDRVVLNPEKNLTGGMSVYASPE